MSNNKIQNVFEFPNANSIVVSGDIHGDFTQLVYKCCVQYGMTDTVIIIAGDCGFGFEKPECYEDLLDDVKRERKVMDDILGYLYAKNHPLRYWFYGHFHQSWHCEIDGVQYNMLDCVELREVR